MGAVSDITVAALTATPTFRGNKIAWTYSDPLSGALPNIALDMVEVWSSTTNDRTTATKAGEGILDFLHAGLVEEQTYYYWIRARDMLPVANGGPGYGAWYPSGSTSGVTCVALGMSGLAFGLANGKLVVTTASSAVTGAIKTSAGTDPSTSDPVYVAFRNAALATGNYIIRQINSAVSLTLPSGATAGFSASDPSSLWWSLFDVGDGTVKLAARNCSTTSAVYPITESGLASTVAADTASDNVAVFYAASALSSRPFRVVGFSDWSSGLGTPGTWSVDPDIVQQYGPAIRLPGQQVQFNPNNVSAMSTGTTLVPADDTIPQNTEGDQYISTNFTPTRKVNLLDHSVFMFVSHSASITIGALFQDSGANAIASGWAPQIFSNNNLIISHFQRAATLSQITFAVRAGGGAAGTLTVNGYSGARYLGGTIRSYHKIAEIMG